jgi:hypothetical protein
MGLEGIVSKRLGSPYRSGRSKDWLKFKNPPRSACREARGGRGMGQGEAVIPTSTLVTNELEFIAATKAAGTDSSTAGGSGFHVDRVALLIAVNWADNPLFGELNFSV